MTKILLVEDDKNLREIYGVRLLAEGYDIVSAGDGEEALAMAIKERPALIVSDVMMPKISGFDMLDILQSTTETKGIKVIMMTALSGEEQRQRGEQLGAAKYLVKSQVGIEDVVRAVHEVLADAEVQPEAAPVAVPAPTPEEVAEVEPEIIEEPVDLAYEETASAQVSQPAPAQTAPAMTVPVETAPEAPTEPAVAPAQIEVAPAPQPAQEAQPAPQVISAPSQTYVQPAPAQPVDSFQPQITEEDLVQPPTQPQAEQAYRSGGERVIQPLNNPVQPQMDDIASRIAEELGQPPVQQ